MSKKNLVAETSEKIENNTVVDNTIQTVDMPNVDNTDISIIQTVDTSNVDNDKKTDLIGKIIGKTAFTESDKEYLNSLSIERLEMFLPVVVKAGGKNTGRPESITTFLVGLTEPIKIKELYEKLNNLVC